MDHRKFTEWDIPSWEEILRDLKGWNWKLWNSPSKWGEN